MTTHLNARARALAGPAGLLLAVLAALSPVSASAATTITTASESAVAATQRSGQLLAALVVLPEPGSPTYDRSAFAHWTDEDGNGCDTRAEVLQAESKRPVTFGSGCTVATGEWFSWFDGQTWTSASDVDVDHFVPLAEAWQSGASAWNASQRRAFANDLGFGGSLEAVTDDVNQSKGAREPHEWLPPDPAATCRYLTTWVQVKYRWRLAVDPAEQDFLGRHLTGQCGDPVLEVPSRGSVPDPVVAPVPASFPDVAPNHPFAREIGWLVAAGITTGYADGTFKPGVPVSRQAFAAYLYRYSHGGAPAPACRTQWFPDVPTTSVFCGEITWLAGTGITGGYSDGTFRPAAPISRQAMAAFLQRYRATAAGTGASCNPSQFSDVTTGTFCADVTWLSRTGITTGYPDRTFRPTGAVTRQALAAYLYRYDDLYDPSSPPVVVSPPPPRPPTSPPPPPPPPPPSIPPNPGDTKNCGDFATWRQAQDWFDRYYPYYGDVARLDGDGDRIACESLPGAP